MDLSSPFLPDNLPDGDPVHYALPVFLDEPEDTFVVKNKAAEQECRVAHAHSVYVQCQVSCQVKLEGGRNCFWHGTSFLLPYKQTQTDSV